MLFPPPFTMSENSLPGPFCRSKKEFKFSRVRVVVLILRQINRKLTLRFERKYPFIVGWSANVRRPHIDCRQPVSVQLSTFHNNFRMQPLLDAAVFFNKWQKG